MEHFYYYFYKTDKGVNLKGKRILIAEAEKFEHLFKKIKQDIKHSKFYVLTTAKQDEFWKLKKEFENCSHVLVKKSSFYTKDYMKNEKFDYIYALPDAGFYKSKKNFIDNRHCSIALEVLSSLLNYNGKLTITLPTQFCISKDNALSLRIDIEENFSIISLKELPKDFQTCPMVSLTIQKFPAVTKEVLIEKLEFNSEKNTKFVSVNKVLISKEKLQETHDWLPAYYLPILPDNMEHARLSDLCLVKRGINYSRMVDNGIPAKLLNVADVNSDFIDLNNLDLTLIDVNTDNDLFLRVSDVVLTCRGGGEFKTGIIKEFIPCCIPSQNIITLRTISPLLNPEYLNIFLQSPKGKQILKDIEGGNLVKNLNLRDVANIEIPLPSLEVQQEIVDKFNKAKESYRTAINQAEQQWQKVQAEIYKIMK